MGNNRDIAFTCLSNEIQQEGEAPYMDVTQRLTPGWSGHLVNNTSVRYPAEA
jgi:hypothetical protein